MTLEEEDLKNNTEGLGLSGKQFSEIEDWEFYDYPSKEAYAEYLEFNRPYEVDSDEDE
jgi:hypothetical protein